MLFNYTVYYTKVIFSVSQSTFPTYKAMRLSKLPLRWSHFEGVLVSYNPFKITELNFLFQRAFVSLARL